MDDALTPPWRPWEAAPVALAAFAVTAIAAVVFTAILGGVGGPTVLLTTFAFQASLAGFTVLWIRFRYPGWVPALRFGSRSAVRDVVLGAWFGAVLFAVSAFAVLPVVRALSEALLGQPPAPINQLPFEFTPVVVALAFVVVVVAAPVGEETFFRGFLFSGIRTRLGFWPAAAISGALFGLLHADVSPVLVPVMFVVGLGLAFLYERRGSLVAAMAAHASFNVVGYTLIVLQRT